MTASKLKTSTASESILSRAMLVDLRISVWEARKRDGEVTANVNKEYAADQNAGNYHKQLFGGKTSIHQNLLRAARGLRVIHNAHTLPWGENAIRLLPTANYFVYAEAIRKGKERFDAALETFIAAYPTLISEAKVRLNGMFREEDYPPVQDIRRRFGFTVDYAPLPSGSDFRVSLPAEELATMAKSVEERVTSQVATAAKDAWNRLGEAVETIKGRLDADGKHLRQSTIDRLRDLSEALGRLNVLGDPTLDSMRVRVADELGTLDADNLRGDDKVRAEAAKKVDDILASMADFYSPAPAAKS